MGGCGTRLGGSGLAGFVCPHCGRFLNVPGLAPGRSVACGYCRRVTTVPAPGAAAAPVTPVAPPPTPPPASPVELSPEPAPSPHGTAPWERGGPPAPPPPLPPWTPAEHVGSAASPFGVTPEASQAYGDTVPSSPADWGLDRSSGESENVGGFNMAPLILGGFWALGNYLPVWGVVGLVPGAGGLVNIYLAFRGNEMSWRTGKWKSVRRFREAQRMWTVVAGVIGVIAGLVIIGATLQLARVYTDIFRQIDEAM